MEDFRFARERHLIFEIIKGIFFIEIIIWTFTTFLVSTNEDLIKMILWGGIIIVVNIIALILINNYHFDAEKILVRLYWKEINTVKRMNEIKKEINKNRCKKRKETKLKNQLGVLQNEINTIKDKREFFLKTRRRNLWRYSKSRIKSKR